MAKIKKILSRSLVPEDLTADEMELLQKVKDRAWQWDLKFKVFGSRFGWSAVFGLVPGVGALVDFAVALSIFNLCRQTLSIQAQIKMLCNLAVGCLMEFIPLVGVLSAGKWKCNNRNAELLEKELKKQAKKRAMKKRGDD